jgi:hypothetical protein
MEGEHSPVPEEIAAGKMEVSRAEATATGSSFGGDSSDRSKGGSGGHDEESGAVDPCEAEHSYDFEPSTITIGCMRQLEALGYLSKVPCASRGKKSFWTQATMRLSCLRSSLLLGSGCRCSWR